MRIPIREQIGILVLLSTLIALAVISVATWLTNQDFVLSNLSSGIALIASLKSNGLATNLALMEASARLISSRARTQLALGRYNSGNNTDANWVDSVSDLGNAISGPSTSGLLMQVVVFPMSDTGPAGRGSLVNVTSSTSAGIRLPYSYANGTTVLLGDPSLGYPPGLYPNLTYTTEVVNSTYSSSLAQFQNQTLDVGQVLLLGPWQVNSSLWITSMTVPIINNTSTTAILGYMTVVMDARLLQDVLASTVGLQNTGTSLLVGPATQNNRFPGPLLELFPPFDVSASDIGAVPARFVFPPIERYSNPRHAARSGRNALNAFDLSSYDAALTAFSSGSGANNNAGSAISTRNEQGDKVAVGYAIPPTDLCAWVLLVEISRDEAYAPINHLRNVLLACVFGTVGVMILLVLPLAHYASLPIRRLRQATRESVDPPGQGSDDAYDQTLASGALLPNFREKGSGTTLSSDTQQPTKTRAGKSSVFTSWKRTTESNAGVLNESSRQFRIPRKVRDGKHIIYDELTDLTGTFNDMADELMMHYTKLEERVQQRTAELELSKKAAEAANESKTLFIANISHELKTPLNGILGMCAVAMQEDDPSRIKRSLGIIYKSGDLLHNLLTDLLTFSKNQVGQNITLDEKGFYMHEIESQLQAIFENQALEGKIAFSIQYEGSCDFTGSTVSEGEKLYGPNNTGRVKDMFVWGDYHRILQVIINLVSNSLKFTPHGGSVTLTIRCVGNAIEVDSGRKSSTTSMKSASSKMRVNSIFQSWSHNHENNNPLGKKPISTQDAQTTSRNLSQTTMMTHASTPPSASPPLSFEFEVDDTGPGIPPHLQESIFLPFVQGDLRLTKKFGGTGLGLSICSQLAKLMSGSIALQSEEGVGSKFIFKVPLSYIKAGAGGLVDLHGNDRLPEGPSSRRSSLQITNSTAKASEELEQPKSHATVSSHFEADQKPRLVGLSQPFFSTSEPPMASPSTEIPAKKARRVRVLVAEDNKVNQEVMLRMLRLEEVFDVHVAKDGQEAYDMVKQSMEQNDKYDLIFMDVQMPNLDGRESTRMIREMGYSAPIVALTAFADKTNEDECMSSGMDYFMAKPIRRPALKQVLKTYCTPIREDDEGATGT